MRTSEYGVEFIKRWEGYRSKAYRCQASRWTIGWGHTQGVQRGDVVDKDTADIMLRKDILHFEPWLEHLIKVGLNQNEWDALLSFTFNLGTTKEYSSAASEFTKWCHATVDGKPKKLEGLLRRRKAEQKLFREPNGCTAFIPRDIRTTTRLHHPR